MVDELATWTDEAPSAGMVNLLQRTIDRLEKVLNRADDSGGHIGDLPRELLDAHTRACDWEYLARRQAPPGPDGADPPCPSRARPVRRLSAPPFLRTSDGGSARVPPGCATRAAATIPTWDARGGGAR